MNRFARLLRWCLPLLLMASGVMSAQAQIRKLSAPDSTLGNLFGAAVAIDGDRALIGASGEDVCGPNSGAAYIYERDADGGWAPAARLTGNDCNEGYFFGRSLALSGDRAVVAAFRPFFSNFTSNAAYVFERDSTGTWHQTARLTAEAGHEEGAFAASVSIDGERLLITASGDVAGRAYHGAAYIFEKDATGQWIQAARFSGDGSPATGVFGTSAALDKDRAVISASTYFANRAGSLYIFERSPDGRWEQQSRLRGIDDLYIALAIDGDRILVGESRGGRQKEGLATLYERQADGTWATIAELHPKHPYEDGGFGRAVSLKGDHALVVGYDEQLSLDFNIDRVVYVFKREDGGWRQQHIIDVGEVAFGSAIDIDAGLALIGQASEQQVGQAYIVTLR